ncbi:MAG: hypothetical protein PHE25_01900 [Candidatus Gracilibacteria bacterium]|nr:hypothetical protein [Candidatus Gracilibacteria bacterium]
MFYLFVLILSTCALVYEFLLSTLSSYLIGNSVLQFSLTIGLFLSGIGAGSFLSRFVKNPQKVFFFSEITLGILGGFSMVIIKFIYAYFFNYLIVFYVFYFLVVIIIGALVGFEIPILGNLVASKDNNIDDKKTFKNVISDVFTYDYIGAIFATFMFPFVLLPFLGLTYTALLLGFFNILIAILFIYQKEIRIYYIENKILFKYSIFLVIILTFYFIGGFFIKNNFENFWDHFFYKEPVVFQAQSKYQNIVITKRGDDIRLLLDGHLQFLSLDEKRYHNSLWSLPESIILNDKTKNNILILGGGDGMLARNVIETFGKNNFKITLVDIDKTMTDTAKTNNILSSLNKKSLLNPNVSVINMDAFRFLSDKKRENIFEGYDIIIADFTDPRDVGIAKLYSREFYLILKNVLKNPGIFVTQSGNAFFAKESFWCINKTLSSVFNEKDYSIIPYKTYIPSFGDWGFNAVIKGGLNLNNFYKNDLVNTKFDKDYIVDMSKININTIESSSIINYFRDGRKRFNL